ncbi:MAG TPA: radical SAM protein [Spirochaetota bacterium]|nr:radical SAM protein [Spirochaetota bacterium]HPV42153.1 radical SAM protein [Spirochaetota bacterium]
MKYLFGPVNSRRLGVSLGVDLMPYKTCSLNCVYCECGGTTSLTSELAEYVPTEDVIAELDGYLAGSPRLDVITFSGSGEPTLHSGIGRIIRHIRERYPQYKIAVLTNGTLLWNPAVRSSIAPADIVVPSLDAVSPGAFEKIGRPAGGITPDRVVDGLVEFRKEFPGRLFLEIFIVPGVNDTPEELAGLRDAALKIRPDSVQVNSLDRPGAEVWVEPAGRKELESLRELFAPLKVEIIGRPAERVYEDRHVTDMMKEIISILRRRPSTLDDLRLALGSDRETLGKVLESMIGKEMITAEELDRGKFYRIV